MANTISKAFVEQFKSNLLHLAEQKGSRLRQFVQEDSVTGDKFNFDRIGNEEAVEKTSRHTPTPVLDIPHSRRTGVLRDWQWGDLIDQEDKVRMLSAPESAYAQAGANSMNKRYDSLIIDAGLGNSLDGDGTTIALPASQKIADGATGMTIAKLGEAREKFEADEIDEDEQRIMVVSARQITNLLNTTEVTSADYNSVKALAQGAIDEFMGFKFVRSQRLPLVAGVRSCMAFVGSGIGLGIGKDVTTRITERDDLSYAVQVYLAYTANAVRVEEEKVQQIDCAEA